MPSVILLEYKHRVSQPLWVKNFHNEPDRQELGHLFSNGLAPFLMKPPKKLPDRLKLWIKLRVCSASSLGTPGMSEGFHGNMSRFLRMNSMSALSYFGSRLALILNYLDESPGTKSTSLVSSADSNFNRGSCSVVGFFKDVISAGSTLSL